MMKQMQLVPDTRPPMLVEMITNHGRKFAYKGTFEGNQRGSFIWKSIQNGPTPHQMVTDPPPTGSTIVPAPRKKLDSEFNDEENKLELADTQAEIIPQSSLSPTTSSTYSIRQSLLRRFRTMLEPTYARIEKNSTNNEGRSVLEAEKVNMLSTAEERNKFTRLV
ncbi:hypothetical protein Tco_1089991 [Tanacetum coccineum]|uniref:Uncharacterized protein n=1 Tax=Tanacetum coccineum TaxID=301880 RepID=A0ABQ5I2Y4_9ASTR